eukprot:TRINITY_DN91017_c0_g1_i1.p1 TRINITY_DN91017_c0_g1~~TRINITY_DN91017_c0_g1_i1.p1  ORF type:complete len:812 (-),score=159.58 TRINITY_DN91017_c0_g1_i1:22-2457(-)
MEYEGAVPENGARRLTLGVSRVEVQMYRRTCTSADRIKTPAHFVYALRCSWSGDRRSDFEFGSHEDLCSQQVGEFFWWDSLPSSYVVRRRWCDIQRFHNVVANELCFDAQGYRRVKSRMPTLPETGELDKFLVSVAATGDVLALNRPEGLRLRDDQKPEEGQALEDLDLLHTIYVDNRLAPYFDELNKVLSELGPLILQGCVAMRKFVTSGVSCRVRPSTPGKTRFFGPGPMMLEPKEISVSAKVHRRAAKRAQAQSGEITGAKPSPPTRTKPPPPAAAGTPGSPVQRPAEAEMPGRHRKSASAPNLALEALDDEEDGLREMSKEEAMRTRRLASSHYGFFAQHLSKKDVAPSQRDFWKRMVTKERREMGRRMMLVPPNPDDSRLDDSATDEGGRRARGSFWLSPDALHNSASASRLPSLPGGLRWQQASAGKLRHTEQPQKEALKVASMKKSMDNKAMDGTDHKEVAMRDLCEGFRTSILGEPISQVPRSIRLQKPMPVHPLPNRDETMKVYRTYFHLLETEGSNPCGDGGTVKETEVAIAQEKSLMSSDARASKELARVAWPTLLSWVQHTEDLAEDFRYRSVIAALNRALHNWRKKQASPRGRRSGVSLPMIIQWMWPNVTDEHITMMMTWICLNELDKFRQPTPPLIDQQDRRALESLFMKLDRHGLGSVLPEDIAGGKDQDLTDQLKNIVDVETVKAVVGEGRIGFHDFLELMCENNFRAHEGAKQVLLSDGRRMVQQDRSAVGITIWVLDGLPAEEEISRRVADVFEAEVLRWRMAAERHRAEMEAQQGEFPEGHFSDEDYDALE